MYNKKLLLLDDSQIKFNLGEIILKDKISKIANDLNETILDEFINSFKGFSYASFDNLDECNDVYQFILSNLEVINMNKSEFHNKFKLEDSYSWYECSGSATTDTLLALANSNHCFSILKDKLDKNDLEKIKKYFNLKFIETSGGYEYTDYRSMDINLVNPILNSDIPLYLLVLSHSYDYGEPGYVCRGLGFRLYIVK